MWSNKYNYYNIQFDDKFSQKLDKAFVVDCLKETELFKQTNHQSFTNTDKFPSVDIILVETYDGNYSGTDKENQYVTLIAIVCPKGPNVNQQIYVEAFLQVAGRLKWKLYLEEDDEGNEKVEL